MSRLSSLSRFVRDASYGLEGLIGGLFRKAGGVAPRSSAASFVERKIGQVAGSVSGVGQGPSRVGQSLEASLGTVAGVIKRWHLNYLFFGLFAGAIGYQLYLLAEAPTPSARSGLFTSLRLTIYFAIVFFSIAHVTASPVRPWSAIADGWTGVLRRIKTLPGAFLACLAVYVAARGIGYLPSGPLSRNDLVSNVGNFVLGFVFFTVLSAATRRIYVATIAPPDQLPDRFRWGHLILACAVVWTVSVVVTQALAPWPAIGPRRFLPIVFQITWFLQMLWTAWVVFVVPSFVTGVDRPLRTALRASWCVLWTLLVTIVIVNFPADLFQLAAGVSAPRGSQNMALVLSFDFVSALVNAIVYFAAQAAFLTLFVSTLRVYGLADRTPAEALP